MPSIKELKEERSILIRNNKNQLREKGAQNWSKADSEKFDRRMDRSDDLDEQIKALDKPREAYDLWVRNDFAQMTPQARTKVTSNFPQIANSTSGTSLTVSQIQPELISLFKDVCPMRRVAQQALTSHGPFVNYPTSDGTAEIGEVLAQDASAASSLSMVFGNASIGIYKFSSKVIAVPFELLQDSAADPIAYIHQRCADRIGRIQNQKLTVGVGGTEPYGFVPQATVGKVGTTGQTLTVVYDDLVDLNDSVDAGHPSLAWMMNQTTRKMVRRVKDTAGRPIWEPGEFSGPSGNGVAGTMFNSPVYINNDMAVPAANAKTIAFGNFQKYQILDTPEIAVFRLNDYAFTQLGQVGFIMMARAGGNLLDSTALKVYQHSAT